ncbi:uncharacterized protein F5Z01DRAFT_248409 [Emericellopsis atlantica]|uniref:Uncharacterized protein n=1 Tax=Emericellopsis atlantica TaxID=2614577 RepID=A0A9P7ZHL2_9HYPO|nr:uncharacterized protein F5Z01DRAFT_248409 [Emericellopsis atlantica]KAG9252071.1 hypothetical protein F5Z01DRAFT_248409 [Emericellopsis atlantica]
MADLSNKHPDLQFSLAPLMPPQTPLIKSPSSSCLLTHLSTKALPSQATIARAKWGSVQRIMLEYPDKGPIVVQSFMEPAAQNHTTSTKAQTEEDQAPQLVGVVAGHHDQVKEVRRAAVRLERVGRDIQREWSVPEPETP